MEGNENTIKLYYNTEVERLGMPEYGRNVLKMVEMLKAIEDRGKRSEQARAVVKVMESLNPQVHQQENFEQKLWDHLYMIAGYDLDIDSPYPEEFNREAVSIISRYNFAPTEVSRQNLIKEGKKEETIFVTGNTAIDALKTTVQEDYTHPELDWARGSRLIFITAHRRENLGEPMHHMFRAIRRVMEEHPDVKALYPIHLNPVVRQAAAEELAGFDRLHLCEPVDVFDCHNLMARSYLILTDSGGIQEEAPSLGKPVLVMRDTTERPEGIKAGTLKLVGTTEEVIYSEFTRLLTDEQAYDSMSKASNPYGDGHASERIADVLTGVQPSAFTPC